MIVNNSTNIAPITKKKTTNMKQTMTYDVGNLDPILETYKFYRSLIRESINDLFYDFWNQISVD